MNKKKEIKFETLKKSHKKQIVIGALVVCIVGGALTFATTRAKYRVTEDIPLVNGKVNYTPYDFKIMAMYQQKDNTTCTDDNCYNEITTIPSSGYMINTSKSYCTTDNTTQVKNKLKTENGEHIFENLAKSDKCYVWFDKIQIKNSSDIIKYSKINTNPVDYSKIATTDEGIFSAPDGMYGGTSYYWRGAATTNHLIFANKCWRIVRINGDGSIRIIYNGSVKSGNTCTGNGVNSEAMIMGTTDAEKYFSTADGQHNNSSYVGWTYTLNQQRPANNATGTSSNAKTQTDNWYKGIKSYEGRITDGKFCNDRDVGLPVTSWNWGTDYASTWAATGTRFAYAGAKRTYDLYAPTLGCNTLDIYTLKAGAITTDEVMLAGGRNVNNTSYYLYTGQHYWTMSPFRWHAGFAGMFSVSSGGYLYTDNVNNTYIGLRPVINLIKDATFSSGSGTQSNPYIVQ